jgi:hypothetical protein
MCKDVPGQEPNPEDPLNKEAAQELQANRRLFEQNVQKTMKGDTLASSPPSLLTRSPPLFHPSCWHLFPL